MGVDEGGYHGEGRCIRNVHKWHVKVREKGVLVPGLNAIKAECWKRRVLEWPDARMKGVQGL